MRELTPRAALYDGDFVGSPVHEGGDIPRWTRWEATATTFGPVGRIVATAVVFGTLIPALAFNGFVYVIVFPVVAVLLLCEIWAKGWYLPETESPRVERAQPEPTPTARIDPEPITVRRLVRLGTRPRGIRRLRARKHWDQDRRRELRDDRAARVALDELRSVSF